MEGADKTKKRVVLVDKPQRKIDPEGVAQALEAIIITSLNELRKLRKKYPKRPH